MMKANELRIGNYLYDSGLKVVKIECLMSDRYAIWDDRDSNLEFSYQSDDINMYHPEPNELCPIPLTDEILRDWCGFDVHPYDDGSGNGKTAEYGSISLDKGNNWEYWNYHHSGGDFGINIVDIDIKYFHQLQNLYFALTGEELTINIPKQ
jgi:hypothetical protein